jgi:diguanylate cyclase (GGDEF)-like protein
MNTNRPAPAESPVAPEILQRLRLCTSFPTPPPVAMQVVQLAQNPDIDLAKVADAVSADPAIAAKVMRIANSAMYARRRQSANLRQALIVLGLNATLTLALSFTLVSTLKRNPPKGFDFRAYWRRTVLCATWGKLLATETGRRDAEEVFLASLLQDLGMLAIDRIWPEVYAGITAFGLEHARLAQHERNCIGTDHPHVGAALLVLWNMPAHLGRAVQHSHDPGAAGVEAEERPFARTVALAGELADAWLASRDNEVALRRIGQQVHKQLGILPNRLAELFDQIRVQLPVAESIFEMDLFDATQLQDITDTAREILIVRNLHALSEVQDLHNKTTRLEEENIELKAESARDALTEVYNRRYFEEAVAREFETASRHAWPLSVVFVDLDKFKEINDTFGHQAGDAVLVAVARLLGEVLRDTDIVARYGGDEFVLLLPGVDSVQADVVGQRLIETAHGRTVRLSDGRQLGITLSVGIATCDSQHRFPAASDLLAAADAALYHSKRNGRDRYTCYDTIRAA